MNKTVVLIPTYNEKENVEKLCSEILSLKLDLDILFIDDSSPDGTGDLLDRLAEKHPNVKVMHRTGKLGIGSAHLDGIYMAYDNQVETLITMDADFTHSPMKILDLLHEKDKYDLVIGSRYLFHKSLDEWNAVRKFMTMGGHLLTRTLLRMKYDASGAFRLYNINKIPREAFTMVTAQGYAFFFESLYILNVNKFSIHEVPIVLPARTYGHSKMTVKEIISTLKRLFETFLLTIVNRSRYKLNLKANQQKNSPENWNKYWGGKKSGGGSGLYGAIAGFYRKYIIRRALNISISKYFTPNSKLLHAGCGSGQVDEDLHDRVSITALDISDSALELYKQYNNNGKKIETIKGDVLKLPFKGESFDGVYNLGVMEHFTEPQIQQILSGFKHILKKKGKAVLFWPPEFGFSVIALKIVHFILNKILKKDIYLHPEEITRVRSKKQVKDLCEQSGLVMTDYYFGPRDLFTQAVVVLEKK
ncbi:glycosyltransferase [Candidatus Margulisiibacteriota bacterium]